jgi:hypothetical protein
MKSKRLKKNFDREVIHFYRHGEKGAEVLPRWIEMSVVPKTTVLNKK